MAPTWRAPDEFSDLREAFDDMRARLEVAFICTRAQPCWSPPRERPFRLRDTAIRTSPARHGRYRLAVIAATRIPCSVPGRVFFTFQGDDPAWHPGAVRPRDCPKRRKAHSGSNRRKNVRHGRSTRPGPAGQPVMQRVPARAAAAPQREAWVTVVTAGSGQPVSSASRNSAPCRAARHPKIRGHGRRPVAAGSSSPAHAQLRLAGRWPPTCAAPGNVQHLSAGSPVTGPPMDLCTSA